MRCLSENGLSVFESDYIDIILHLKNTAGVITQVLKIPVSGVSFFPSSGTENSFCPCSSSCDFGV